MRTLSCLFLASFVPFGVLGCSDAATTEEPMGEKWSAPDTSAIATILDFEFDGELLTDSSSDDSLTIRDQLLYTIGHLNHNKSVGRLDALTLTDIESTQENGKTRITYHAKMPVAWGSKTNLPTSYTFSLPRDVSYPGTDSFTTKYKSTCVEEEAHDMDAGSMWYYYRPARSGCKLAESDVVKIPAKVTVSTVNTTGKYPEYHKIWEDNVFKVVAVFGKYEEGATSGTDAGIAAYNEFVGAIRKRLEPFRPTTRPATVSSRPGVRTPDVEFVARLDDTHSIQVNALLVDNVAYADSTFYARYEALSTSADLIAYNGHAGLGQNVRALAKQGKWVAGKYVVVFMNGCDTYAYVDGSLAETRAVVNPDDSSGTKFMEIVTNAMPAYFASDSEATMALINGLLSWTEPRTYERMFRDIDSHQVVLVTGEHDNVYVPGSWPLSKTGMVTEGQSRRWQTPSLAPGKYVFRMIGTGNADLYVRVGAAPTLTRYDCRPYRPGSNESCAVDIATPAPVHVMVHGQATTSTFRLTGK